MLDKGNIDDFLNNELKRYNADIFTKFFDTVFKTEDIAEKNSFLELSRYFSNSFNALTGRFKEGFFISDDPFECMMSYHFSNLNKMNIKTYNYNFTFNRFETVKLSEKFDFIYSVFGIAFDKLYELLPQIINYLKMDGVFAYLLPSYWYLKDDLNDDEKAVLNYSKQNDKKWIFVEPLDKIISDSGAVLKKIMKLDFAVKVSRLDLSYLSGLSKLHDAALKNNTAHLEVSGIKEKDIELNAAVLLIRKTKKTLTRDNLFKL